MRKFAWVSVVLGCMFFAYSCTKDKTPPPANTTCTSVDSVANTYNLRIKAILDVNCATVACHDAVFYNSGVILDNYTNSKAAFESKPSLCAIKQEGGCLPMPQGADKLADSLITYIQCWAENGYPE
ncbi:MAG TPA: hypothetical protein VK174_07485 [Chitinophagales bacterium]|nr:hypothetical protein [Chitinophagales bacterium]